MEVESDGWKEHEAKIESQDKKCDEAIYYAAKQRVYGKYFSFHWKPGEFERIFGGKQESNDKDKPDGH